MKVAALALLALTPLLTTQVQASSSTPSMNSNYSTHPVQWYNAVSELEYFDTNFTNTWVTNPACDNNADFTAVTYNIFHNVGFVYDFGDEMEQSLGKVTECADVIMLQEAWDYDDMYEDGPVDDFAARGFEDTYGGGSNYCNGTDIEADCPGLMIFSRHGYAKKLGYHKYNATSGIDGVKGKGVIGAIVEKNGQYIYVFTTHLVYGSAQHFGGNSSDDNARRGQMNEAISWMKEKIDANAAQFPPAAVILGGDFNTDLQNPAAVQNVTQSSLWDQMALIRNQSTEVRDGLQYSYWPKDACCEDTGPNGLATDDYAWFDYTLVLDAANWNIDAPTTGCGVNRVNTSVWAPEWRGQDGQRYLAYYTHSDHYGSLTEIDFCQP